MTQQDVNASWDVVVIGAGPAGSVAARELARLGVRTLLVEKSTFPRSKVCGGCLNRNALSSLNDVGLGQVPIACGGIPIRKVALATQGRRATIEMPQGMAVSRKAFDAALVNEAVRSGVTFRSGVKAVMGELSGNQRIVELIEEDRRSTAFANIVIVADGLNGRAVNQDRNATPASKGSRIGAGVVFKDSFPHEISGQIHMAIATGGYVGCVRVEDDQLDFAAAFDPEFVRKAGGLGLAAEMVLHESGFPAVPGLAEAEWKGTPALTRQPVRIAGTRWFAVGDSAGYVEPFTGEGMAWAIAGAIAVAEIASRGVRQWNDELTREWSAAHRRIVSQRQLSCRVLSRLLRSPTACRWLVAGLAFSPSLAAPVVRMLNRPSRTFRGHS